MADKIAVMNHGVIEQFGHPQEIYDRPATMFVADFIGSPPMNFLDVEGGQGTGAAEVRLCGAQVPVPELREQVAAGSLVLGMRPEHVRFDDASALRGEVIGAEYLGTTQIVTVTVGAAQLKARIAADVVVREGESVGLTFDTARLSLFDRASGRALASARDDAGAVLRNGTGG